MRGLVLGMVLLLAACSAEVVGDLRVDGKPFVIENCRSGQALGFSGILFADDAGRHLRLFANPDGTTSAAIFQPGATRGDNLGLCGTLAMQAQHSRVNSIVNLQGTATLACEAVGHRISGEVKFANCH